MKGFGKLFTIVAMIAAFSAVFFASDAFAQGRAGRAATGTPLKIKGFTGLKNTGLMAAPQFDGKVKGPNRNSGRNKRWAAMEVEYLTAPEWIDEATFTFHVMTRAPKGGYHYFTTSVSYINIAKGEHGACVMLPPNAVARYGMPVAIGAEVEVDGETVAADSDGQGKGTPWWTKLEALGDKLEQHPGLLVDRSETPFGITFTDEYEVVR